MLGNKLDVVLVTTRNCGERHWLLIADKIFFNMFLGSAASHIIDGNFLKVIDNTQCVLKLEK